MTQVLSRAVLGAALLYLSPAALLAAEPDHQHAAAMDMSAMKMDKPMTKPTATVAVSEGKVKKIDKAAGKVTLAHGPLANLGMPAMTMAFKADPPQALDRLKEGDMLRFVAEDRQGTLYATRIETAK